MTEVEYAVPFLTPDCFQELFNPSEVKEVRLSARRYADLRKFSRGALHFIVDPEVLKTGLQATLVGIRIYISKGQSEQHFITTMRDGTVRTFCQDHHVFLAGPQCRYCEGENSTPVTEFNVPERIIMPPITDEDTNKQYLIPLSVYCGVSDNVQSKFDTLAKDHQKTCQRRHFGVENRWIFTFEPTDAWLESWVKITAKCKLCGVEVLLLDECDLDSPYAKYQRP